MAEGEHGQFEIVKHASTVGARVFCGSSGVGWAYAMECLVVTPPLRVPMVALVGNRALDDPGAFGVEHNDALFVAISAGCWCRIDTSQEALDTTLIAYRVAEDRRVFLPLAISADGAFLTHSQAITLVPPKAKVDQYLPRYNRGDLQLHPDNPITVAPQANEDWVIEIRRQNDEAMKRAYTVIEEAYADFRRVFGRGPENPWFEEYMTDDADVILIGMGTISLPIKVGIRNMRAQGKKVGLVGSAGSGPSPRRSSWPPCRRPGLSESSTATTPSARRSPRGWWPTRFAPAVQRRPAAPAPQLHRRARRARGDPGGHLQSDRSCYSAANSGKSDARTHWLGVRE